MLPAKGKPYVKLPETVTVIEEEKLKLECTVVGSNSPYVEWKVGKGLKLDFTTV